MSHIPLYVFIIFFVLVSIGIKRGFMRTIQLRRLFITPLFFTVLSVRGVDQLFHLQPANILFWLVGGAMGLALGYKHVQNRVVRADHQNQLIQLPGDWSILALIMAIFSFEFFVHYSIDANLAFASTPVFQFASVTVLGMIAGLSIGRTFNYYVKYQQAESVSLVASH